MKKSAVFFLLMFCVFLRGSELDLSSAKLRGCRGTWEPPRVTALRPGRAADLYFDLGGEKDLSRYNCIEVELTPLKGKFIGRDVMTGVYSGKEIGRFRPEATYAGEFLTLNHKVKLFYNISRLKGKKVTGIRILFNRIKTPAKDSVQVFLVHKVRLINRFVPRHHAQFRYKVNTPVCTLLADDDRGLNAQEACYDDHGPRLKGRPTPVARLLADNVTGRGTAVKESIPVELLNESAVPRKTQVRFGVPFARKKLFSVSNLALQDEKGKAVPAQFAVLSRYEDDSLRHLLVTAPAEFAPGEKKTYRLFFGSSVRALPVGKALKYTFADGVLRVDAGRLKSVVRQKGFNFAEEITVDGRKVGKFLPAELVTADGKVLHPADPDRFEIIEKGPLRLTLRAAGKYSGKGGSYVCRITYIYNRPGIDVEFTHLNTVLDHEFTDFKSLTLNFAPAEKVREKGRIFQETDEFYSRNGGKRQKGRLSGAFSFTDHFGVALADWYQRYPKAVSAADDRVSVELLPRQPHKKFNTDLPLKLSYLYTGGNYRMKWGMSFSERISFDFGGTSPAVLAAERNLPVYGVLPFAVYRKAGFVPDDSNLAPVNAKATAAFNRYLQRQEREREFGFFNYGDSFGERGHSWTNNEYDPVHGVLETYLRTGNRAMLRYAVASARHQADVDTCHAYPNAYFIGSNLQHSVGHSGVGKRWSAKFNRYTAASNGHSWVRGRLMVWLLTGDSLVMDSAFLFGDHVAFAAVPNYKTILGKAPRETGWMLRGLSALCAVTRDPEYFKAARTMADLAVRECAYEKGAWPRVNRRLRDLHGVTDVGNNSFQVAVMIKGLEDYYKVCPDPAVRKAIISSARWLAKAFNPGASASFNYDIDYRGRGLNWPVSQLNPLIAPALAEAAVLADDPALFAVARRAFAFVVLGIAPEDHKHFAIVWSFFADYLRAEAEWNKKHGLVSDYTPENQRKVFFDGVYPEWRVRGPGKWEILSLKDNAKVILRRWIRSGSPREPASYTLRDAGGKIILSKKVRADILRQDFSLSLPGKKGSRFILEISDTPQGDWMLAGSSRACYAVFMTPDGLASAQNGLRRFFFKVPAGKKAGIIYSGSHLGEWSIRVEDMGKVLCKEGVNSKLSLDKVNSNHAAFTLPVSGKDRIVQMDCFAATDARIQIKGVEQVTADRRFFKK